MNLSWPGMRLTVRLIAFLLVVLPAAAASVDPLDDLVQERIRRRIESDPSALTAAGDRLTAVPSLIRFYEGRTFRPAWTRDGHPLSSSSSLLAVISTADEEGLVPAHYHLDAIQTLMDRLPEALADPRRAARILVDLDLLMTDAFLVLGSHFLAGHVDPESIDPEWRARRRDADMVPILEEVMEGASAGDALRGLLPEGEGYRLLRAELRNYRALDAAGGWARIPGDGVLQRGDDGPRVEALRSRLTATGDLTATPDPAGGGEVFDDGLDAAVRRFQARHGLDADGKAGPRTLAALNRSAAERADQIAVNMERWRWLPQDLGSSYVLVNIADFHLDYVEGGVPILAMRAIVGRSARRTPVFSDQIRYMVVNPSWEVPPKLAVEDILPEVRKDSSYLTKMGIQVFEGWGTTEREVDPASIDWSTVTARNFRYRFRQRPGPTNALGKLKFMFPNKFNIYLHDTPKRDLFQRTVRDFSSGCVRVEQPLDLAARLLRDDASWDQESISSQIESGREKTIPLPEPIPVHLLYWTAWVDEDGTLQFREDLYGRDRRVLDSLRASRPDPEGAP